MAIDLNNIEILKELIAHKDIDVISSILNSSVFNFIQNYYFLMEFLYKNNGVYFIFFNIPPLYYAILFDKNEVVKILMTHENININEKTVFYI